MATNTVAADEQGVHGIQLAAGTVDTVTFTDDVSEIEIVNMTGTAAIYFTVDGTEPTVGGKKTRLLPAAITTVEIEPPTAGAAVAAETAAKVAATSASTAQATATSAVSKADTATTAAYDALDRAARALARNAHVRIGSINVPILALGATVDVAVTWSTPMPTADYNIDLAPVTSTLIGKVTATVKANTRTANGVTITLRAGLAVSVAGVALVIASTLA